MIVCENCGCSLTVYDVGFYKKMVSRAAEDHFMCINCTAAYFQISTQRAWGIIDHFRKMGCTLFPPEQDAAFPADDPAENH